MYRKPYRYLLNKMHLVFDTGIKQLAASKDGSVSDEANEQFPYLLVFWAPFSAMKLYLKWQ